MKNLHITCDNLEQRQNVFDVLDTIGYRSDGFDGYWLNIQVNPETMRWMTWVISELPDNTTKLTYTQFMEQYAMQTLKNKITEATKFLNISQRQLSKDIGKSTNYLSEMVRNGCTTAKQKELIGMIDMVMRGEVFKSDDEIIAELTKQLTEVQDQKIELGKHWEGAFNKQKSSAQEQIEKLHKASIKLMQESDGYHRANTELNQELNAMRKNTQESDRALKQAKDDLEFIEKENNQLRKAVIDRDGLNTALNAENAELAEQLGFKTKAIYELTTELEQTIEFSQRTYEAVCNEKIKLQGKLKSANNWTMAFIILTLVLFGLLVWGV
jgi:DNA repair exonuclease SbcCD ATPase subunit